MTDWFRTSLKQVKCKHQKSYPCQSSGCYGMGASCVGPCVTLVLSMYSCSYLHVSQMISPNHALLSLLLLSRFADVVATDDFLTADYPTLLKVVTSAKGLHPDMVVFRAAWSWVIADVKNVQYLEPIMRVVKIPDITFQELVALGNNRGGPLPSSLQAAAAAGASGTGAETQLSISQLQAAAMGNMGLVGQIPGADGVAAGAGGTAADGSVLPPGAGGAAGGDAAGGGGAVAAAAVAMMAQLGPNMSAHQAQLLSQLAPPGGAGGMPPGGFGDEAGRQRGYSSGDMGYGGSLSGGEGGYEGYGGPEGDMSMGGDGRQWGGREVSCEA